MMKRLICSACSNNMIVFPCKDEASEVVKEMPNPKPSGLDGLNGGSLKYADPLLCLLFSFVLYIHV